MKIWIITDTHFNHEKIKQYCGRPDNFEELLFKNMMKIDRNDVLIHLGDICIGKDAEMHEKYIRPLPFKKWLAKGNHDGKSDQWYLEHGWDFVASKFQGKYFGKTVVFSHQPQHYEEIVDLQFGAGSFDINIHGHFHNTLHRLLEGKFIVEGEKERNEIDLKNLTSRHKLLSVEETNYKPVLLEEFLLAGMEEKP